MKRQTSQLLTAPAGTGKSYFVTLDIVKEFLPSSSGRVFTNMPFGVVPDGHTAPPNYPGETFADRIGDYVAKRSKLDAAGVAERINLIDRETLQSWMRDGKKSDITGPWDYFEGFDLENDLIVIDEAHNFVGRTHTREKKRLWMEFVGELRHRGHSAIQFVTQSPNKLAKEIIDECGLRQALVDAEEERDPFFGIRLAYWYELRAKLTGKYTSCFVRIDLRDIDGKKKKSHVVRVPRKPEIFALYDSFNATEAGEAGSAGRSVREYEKRGWLSFLWWFFSRNASSFFRPAWVVLLICLLIFYGKDMFGLLNGSISGSFARGRPKAAFREPRAFVADSVPVARGPVVVDREVVADVVLPSCVLRVISPDTVCFEDGVVLRRDDSLVSGPLEGYWIEQIDYSGRCVHVQSADDAVVLYLGRVYQPGGEASDAVDTAAPAGGESGSGSRIGSQ